MLLYYYRGSTKSDRSIFGTSQGSWTPTQSFIDKC